LLLTIIHLFQNQDLSKLSRTVGEKLFSRPSAGNNDNSGFAFLLQNTSQDKHNAFVTIQVKLFCTMQ